MHEPNHIRTYDKKNTGGKIMTEISFDTLDKAVEAVYDEAKDSDDFYSVKRFHDSREVGRHDNASQILDRLADTVILYASPDLFAEAHHDDEFDGRSVYTCRRMAHARLSRRFFNEDTGNIHVIKATGGSYRGGMYLIVASSPNEAVGAMKDEDDTYLGTVEEWAENVLNGEASQSYLYQE